MSILGLISNGNFISVNRDLIKLLGIETALLLGELASEFDYYYKQGQLINGYFYSTVENIKNNTGLSEHQQRKAFKILQEYGIVIVKKMGIPAKRYVYIDEQEFLNLYDKWCKNYSTSALKFEALEVENLSTNNNIINKHKNNNIIINNQFNELWRLYPKKQGKKQAQSAFERAIKNGTDFEEIKKGLEQYIDFIKENKVDNKYIKQGSTWFRNECWNDEYTVKKKDSPSYDLAELMKIR